MPSKGEPTYIIAANIRRYERMLANPSTAPKTREVLTKLLAEAHAALEEIGDDERASAIC